MARMLNPLSRRAVLRGVGGMSLGLPWLSAMLKPGRSHADEHTPVRLCVLFTPGGTLLDQWRPKGTATNFTLSKMMSPLQPYLSKMVFVDGLDLSVTKIGVGHPHSRGMAGLLTGQQLLAGPFATNGGNASFADGPSIDQVIAAKISQGTRFKSIELATGWSTGLAVGGAPHPGNQLTMAASKMPIPPQTNPWNAFKGIFGDGTAGKDDVAAKRQARTMAVMDAVSEQYRKLSSKLSREDKDKLNDHLALVEDARKRLAIVPASPTSCVAPTNVNSTANFYEEALFKDTDGQNVIPGAKVPEKGRVMTDILVAAMACDMTRVGTMQWSDSEANFQLKFLKGPDGQPLADHHHGYQHDRGFQPGALEVIYNWYAQNFAYLLQRLDSVKEGNGTMLDNTLVLAVTEIQRPDSHASNNTPFMLAGKAGGKLKPGPLWLKVASQPHNNLLVSVLNMFGLPQSKFGHPDHCTGALAGLVWSTFELPWSP